MVLLVRDTPKTVKTVSAVRRQRRWTNVYHGRAAPDVAWTGLHHRYRSEEYFAQQIIDEDRYWNARKIQPEMYKQLMKFRWMDAPRQPRIAKEDWTVHVGDVVEIVEGEGLNADIGHRGRVLDIFYPGMKLKVEQGRMKESEGTDPQTGRKMKQYSEGWLSYREVRLIDPLLDKAVDVETMAVQDPMTGLTENVRVSRASGTVIPLPPAKEPHTKTSSGAKDGTRDTSIEVANMNTLENESIAEEINNMALVKLKAMENHFVGELEKLYAKDKVLRDNLAEEKKEFQYSTYQLALRKVYDQVQHEAPELIPEVAALRAGSRPAPGTMPDFIGEQETYRELRRGARFQLRNEMPPPDVETLAQRYTRTTQRGAQLQLHKEIRDRFEKSTIARKGRTTGKAQAIQKLKSAFKMSPAEYIQDAMEFDSAMRESLEQGELVVHKQETYVGWKPAPLRKRDEMDEWSNRFAHMEPLMGEAAGAAPADADAAPTAPPADGKGE
eukprot:TRINITY_DN6270_c0_g1_i1.p1 TRINITY_DN6270_c0_g1~~TRINITY_DN6270_c0_g1_i1.p1  ORF type:complete len:497 (+),score=189.13 TRINITY_DN6270_c0_g1_i1:104-1594(+)